MKPFTMFIALFVQVACSQAQTKQISVIDSETGSPIEKVMVFVSWDGKKNMAGYTDKSGSLTLNDSVKSEVTLVRVGYEKQKVKLTNSLCDTLRMTPNAKLRDVVVMGSAIHIKNDRIVYYVEADSGAVKESLIETLRKMPGLMISRKGSVSSDDEKKIVYRINGLNDPLTNSPMGFLSALKSKYVKKIELITRPSQSYGSDVVVLNISTKGRLEGYMLTMNVKGTDSNLFSSAWGTSKVNRIRFSGCGSFNKLYGHSSTVYSEEVRLKCPLEYRTITNGKSNGTVSNDYNVELSASYDVDDHSLLAIYGRAFFRNDMSWNSHNKTQVVQQDNSPSYSYAKILKGKLKSPEYQASVSFERVLGINGDGGKFFLGYSFYGRPYREKKEACYQEIDSVIGCANSISNLKDYLSMNNSEENWHTLEVEYKKRIRKNHLLVVGTKGVFRIDCEDNGTKYSQVGLGIYSQIAENYQYSRIQKLWKSSLGYTYDVKDLQLSLNLQYERDMEKMSRKSLGYSYKTNFDNLLPSVGVSYSFSGVGSLSLGYVMTIYRPNISALDSYVDSTVVNELRYGNPNLKPQRNQKFSLNGNFRIGKKDAWYLGVALSYLYSDRILLDYSYLSGSVLHATKGNVGYKNDTQLELSLRKRLGNLFFRTVISSDYIQYSARKVNLTRKGWYVKVRSMVEYELPKDYYLEVEGSYHSKYIMLQGYGTEGYEYGMSLTKKIFHNRFTLMASAYNFLPVHFRWTSSSEANYYQYNGSGRNYQASFLFSVRYNFGHLKSRVRQTQKQIVNDDIKTDYNE